MSSIPIYPAFDPEVGLQMSPTDITAFVRLDQCQRYLRLRMHSRTEGMRFLDAYDVDLQVMSPLLRQSGARFEGVIGADVPHEDLGENRGSNPDPDNTYVVERGRFLRPETHVTITQPRLHVRVGNWLLRGDIDILRLERNAGGQLHALIVDTKASRTPKVEHRLQVAFYREMLQQLFAEADVALDSIDIGVLYRGPATMPDDHESEEFAKLEHERQAAAERLGATAGFLEIVADPEAYRRSVRDLVTDPGSVAARVADAEFQALPFHLTYKCDGCAFNQFCMKWCAEHDDVSLIPHLTAPEKSAIVKHGITTTRDLATLKEQTPGQRTVLRVTPGREEDAAKLAATWPVGPRLDELIHRAQSYRRSKGDAYESVANIPSTGHTSLPYSDAQHNPNLVRVFIDAQQDFINDRLYLIGALIVANTGGDESLSRQRHVVHMTDGPPDTLEAEEQLIDAWTTNVLGTIGALAEPDEFGEPKAPIHLIFYNRHDQEVLLDALARHSRTIFATTPLYDFVTQEAAYDSPVISFLADELRERKNLPIVCQSLHNVASYLRFPWDEPEPYRRIFRQGVFDITRRREDDGQVDWYTGRSRFGSEIPLEYAYAAWDRLRPVNGAKQGEINPFRSATIEHMIGFQRRRLDAMQAISRQFHGNRDTMKTCFDLSVLDGFVNKADTFAQALDEFTTVERHTEMAEWRRGRLAPPERRVLAGECFVLRYEDADQTPEIREKMVDFRDRHQLRKQYEEGYQADNPGEKVKLTKDQKQASAFTMEGLEVSLRIETDGIDCDLDQMLALTVLGEGDTVVIEQRWSVDSRLPEHEQRQFTPTPKQLLWALRGKIMRIEKRPDHEGNPAGFVDLQLQVAHGGGWRGYAYGTMTAKNVPLNDGDLYTIDPDPNNWYGSHQADLTSKLCERVQQKPHIHPFYSRLIDTGETVIHWPDAAVAGQSHFLAGLDALAERMPNLALEPGKREYIGGCGDDPILVVQGPPGTGKSYTSAFAVLARIQGALAAGMEFRVFLSCKTHSAIDVLLHKIADVQGDLAEYRTQFPELFATYFDARLLDLPLIRFKGKVASPDPIIEMDDETRPKAIQQIMSHQVCVVGATPAAIRTLVRDLTGKELFGTTFCDLLVLDEASQMNLPEALLASLPLKPDGQVIVVGDHRQMPPIVHHDWASERRRTFQEFASYESLFLTLVAMQPRMIRFEESFRLHADIAEFLRREIYQQDGINLHSHQFAVLHDADVPDAFVRAVLEPKHPMIVIVHDERASQVANAFEVALMRPVLETLGGEEYDYDARHGLGVVVPHRAQRALYRTQVPIVSDAVQTVEKFQGDERIAIVVSATESDPEYLAQASDFLLDPRRLNVALSRAKQKIILVASRSVFQILSTDEATFHNAQLWKNLLHQTCTTQLWQGEVDGVRVQVFGNTPRRTQRDHHPSVEAVAISGL